MPSRDPVIKRLQGQRYSQQNRERIRAYNRSRKRNRTEYMRQWWKNHPEKQKEHSEKYRLRNAAALQKIKRDYYLKNRPRLIAKQKAWYEANREKVLADCKTRKKVKVKRKTKSPPTLERILKARQYAREYARANREMCRVKSKVYERIRRQRIKFGEKWFGFLHDKKALRARILFLHTDPHSKCAYCEMPLFGRLMHIDHAIPLSRGGRHAADNVVPSCPDCNQQKHNKTPEEFRRYMLLLKGTN